MAGRRFYEFGSFRLDPARRLLSRQGAVIPLTPKVLDTLLVLVENRGRAVDKEELMNAVWPDTFIEEGNLAQNISVLRKVLGESPAEHAYIETIPKRGYRFVAGVTETTASPGLSRRRTLLWAAALLAVLGIAASALLFLSRRTKPPESPLAAVPLTTYPGIETGPSFSPDGNQVAFSWNGEKQDNFDIYVRLIGTEKPLRLTTDPAVDSSPAWSPDGRSIAFVRAIETKKAAILLVPAIGGPERKLAEVQAVRGLHGSAAPLEWTPDGRWLLIADTSSSEDAFGLFLISVESGEKRRLTSAPKGSRPYGDLSGAFSAERRTLAFTRARIGVCEVCFLALAGDFTPKGEPECSSVGGRCFGKLVWTRDGREVVFSSGYYVGVPSLWRMAVSGSGGRRGAPQRLSSLGEGSQDPAVSRDGRLLAFTSSVVYDSDIWRIELPDSSRGAMGHVLKPVRHIASTRRDWNPQYSPDGRKIVFLSTRSGRPAVWVCDGDGANAM